MLTITHTAEIVISNSANRPEWQLAEAISAEGVGQLFMAGTITV